MWDARTGTPLLELKGHTSDVMSVAFSPDGTRIVTSGRDQTAKVWDARTGRELNGEPIPQTNANGETSPDGRSFAYVDGNRVEVLPLRPDAEELAYRRLHTQPSLERYREGYEAARADKDDFAARFYLNLLPPAEQKMLTLEADAEREIAAGRTQDALVPLVALSAAKPEDTILSLKVAALQAWFGQEKEFADTCARALNFARGTSVLATAERAAKVCCLCSTHDSTRRETALALARQAVKLGKTDPLLPWFQTTLGMAEYRCGNESTPAQALLAAAEAGKDNPYLTELVAFYRAMDLFRQGMAGEARKLALAAAAKMKPLPKDDKNPLVGDADHDDLILWLAYKEAKALIQFNPSPPPSKAK